MTYSIETLISKAKEIKKNACIDYHTLREKDKNDKAITLKPGENLGFSSYNGFYFSENRDKCDDMLSGYRAKMGELIKELDEEINKKRTEPPTTEQANLLTALSVGEPTKEDLQAALNENKSNYMTYAAINRIAAANSIYLDDSENPLNDLQAANDYIKNSNNSLYTADAERSLSPSMMAFADAMSGF